MQIFYFLGYVLVIDHAIVSSFIYFLLIASRVNNRNEQIEEWEWTLIHAHLFSVIL